MGCDPLRQKKVPQIWPLPPFMKEHAFDSDEFRHFVQFRHFYGNDLGETGVCERLNRRSRCTPDADFLGSFSLKTRPINWPETGFELINSGY